MSDAAEAFMGHQPRECGEHRTVGPHRAYCLDCCEWCYPDAEMGCKGCRIPILEGRADGRWSFTRDQLVDVISRLEAYPATLESGRVVIMAESMADAIIEGLGTDRMRQD